jgi:exopolyphosphatase/guanosine-5'-triphosphate,3'-diphosphate pyrophosphatase
MRCACIDIGSNTTRLLVADAARGRLIPVLEQRAFTRIGRKIDAVGAIPEPAIAAVADVVAAQRAAAELAGAAQVRVVATAAIRRAANRGALVAALRAGAGVDVGGMSTEIAIGTMAEGVTWLRSFAIGSGMLAGRCREDPPSRADLEAMRAAADAAFHAADAPALDHAVAVGGSAASLPTLVGPVLDRAALERALETLGAAPAATVARRHGLAPERAQLLPAGILGLGAAAQRLGMPLRIGRGGLREGVVLELADRS